MIAEEKNRKEKIKLQLNFEILAKSDYAMVQRKDKVSMLEATYIGKQPTTKKKKKKKHKGCGVGEGEMCESVEIE